MVRFRQHRIIWMALFLLSVPAFLWAVLGEMNAPPLQTLSLAYDALQYAGLADAPVYALERYRQAGKLLRYGEDEMARQNQKLPPFRSYVAADSLFLLALGEALAAARDARTAFGGLKVAAGKAVKNFEQNIESRRRKADNFLVIWEVEKLLSSAMLKAKMCNRLLSHGEYKEALAQVDTGSQILARLDKLVDQYESEESGKHSQWNKWIDETVAYSRKTGATAIVVDKLAHKLFLFSKGRILRAFNCELGYNSARQKLVAGDGATPEGKYTVTTVREHGSKFYKALLLNYPNEGDKKRFAANKAKGIIGSHNRIGGLIEIHGEGGQNQDWTDGCIALTNSDMDHLMKSVRIGTPVTIVRRSNLRS